MKYFVTLYGKEYEVDVHAGPDGRRRATVGDQEFLVDLHPVEVSRRYSLLLDQRSFDVVAHRVGGLLHLLARGRRYEALVEDSRQRAARRIGAKAPRGPTTLESAMPGVVREVRVAAGDAVAEGQPLIILEAMKMENELCADQAGVVREILVAAGTAVEGGIPLVVLDPVLEDQPTD